MLHFFLVLSIVWGSLVIDLPQNDPTPALNYDFKITNVISFCIRFRFEGLQGYRSVFCSDPFCMKFEISQQYGFVFLNGETFIFKIPNDSITPYAWHNFCFSFDGEQYLVVVEGNIWHQTNRQSCSRFWEGCYSGFVKNCMKCLYSSLNKKNYCIMDILIQMILSCFLCFIATYYYTAINFYLF